MSWRDRATKVDTTQSWKNRATKVEPAPEESNKLESAVGGLTQGATMGFIDEAEGLLSALLRPTGVVGGGGAIGDISYESPTLDLDTIKAEYTRARDAARERLAKQEQDNEATFRASEVVGGFATPAFGAAKAIGAATKGAKGIMQAAKTGAVAGAAGSGAATVGHADELQDVTLPELGESVAFGGTVGGVLGGTLKGLGEVGGAIAESDIGQKVRKVYEKSKQGTNLIGQEATEGFNKELLNISKQITEEVKDTANKFKDEYAQEVKSLKIANPEKFSKELTNLADDLAEQQVRGGMIDVRTVDDTINRLRKDNRADDDKLMQLRSRIMELAEQKRAATTKASFTKAQQSIKGQEIKGENLELKKEFTDRIRQAEDELKEAQRAYQDNPFDRAELKIEKRNKEDALKAIRREAQDAGFDIKDEAIKSSRAAKEAEILNRSSSDIINDTSGIQKNIDELMTSKINRSRQISDLVEAKQQANNTAFSGLLNQLELLKKGAPKASLADIKDVNLNSIRAYAEQMGRPDLVTKIDDLIRSNVPGAKNLDAKYADVMAGLNEMGLKLDNFSTSAVKNADAETQLVQKLKLAAKDPTGVSANALRQSREILKNENVNKLMQKGIDVGESYNLSKDITQAGPKSFALRGAAFVGREMDNAIMRGISRLGNTPMGQKLKAVADMPPGDARNRALFTLSQQSWFREVTKDENNK